MDRSRLLTIVILLQVLTLAGQWLGQPTIVAPARAQVPDAGAIRLQILDESRATNAKLDKLIDILENGKIQVVATRADAKK